MARKTLKGRAKPKIAKIRKNILKHVNWEKAIKTSRKRRGLDEEEEGAESTKALVPTNAKGVPLKGKAARIAKQEEKLCHDLYQGDERVLIIGEGNLTFARALCRHLGKGEGVYATNFDDEATLRKKYPDYIEVKREIEEDLGGNVLCGVDATQLHKVKEFRKAFKKIIWNFPHIGAGDADVERSIAAHRELLSKFFASAYRCLAPGAKSAIHVSLKLGEPYKEWRVVQTARSACPELDLKNAIQFAPHAWPGYSHRRTHGFDERFSKADSQELAKGAKVYLFGRHKGVVEEESA